MNPRRGGFARALGAFVLGATAGSITALLYAPASGEVTRRRIRTKFQRAQTQLAKQARQLQAAAVERVGQTREWVMERLPLANGRHPANHRPVHSS